VCEKASLLGWCQAGEEKADADKVHQGLLRAGEPFVVFAQPTLPPNPGKDAFDNPPFGQHPKAWLVAQIDPELRSMALELPILGVDDLDGQANFLGSPAYERAGVALIGPDALQARTDTFCCGQDEFAPSRSGVLAGCTTKLSAVQFFGGRSGIMASS
jgi:hypothetical protein